MPDPSLVIVVNPGAGSAHRGALPLGARTHELGEDDDLAGILRTAAGEQADVIGVLGGDGSTGAAAGIAVELDRVLLPLPGGTLNHFCRALGVDTLESAADALRRGDERRVDVGEVNGVTFVNNASLGLYGDMVRRREHLQPRLPGGKWLAASIALAQALWHAQPMELLLQGLPDRVFMVFVGNNRYRGLGDGARDRLDEGVLDVIVLRAPRRLPRLRALLAVVAHPVRPSRLVVRGALPELRVRLTQPTSLAYDGEAQPIAGEVVFRSRPQALRVAAPA